MSEPVLDQVSGDGSYDVAIVGAGTAGLACARRLRARGISHILLEAADAIGGRARTTTPASLGGAWLDEGASWLHAPDANPLVPLARDAGIALADAWSDRHHLLFTADGTRATAADERAYEAAERDYARLLASHDAIPRDLPVDNPRDLPADTPRAPSPDIPRDRSVADAAEPFRRENPWGPTLETWEATIIAAADAPLLSLRDCRANALPGGDLAVDGGVGALVRRLLAPAPPTALALGTPVLAVDRTEAGHVRLDTPGGPVRARRVVVTVSTGVLRAGAIRFTPDLPDSHRDAIARLPMGLLSKIALRLADPGAIRHLDGLPPGESALIERQLARPGEPFMLFHACPRGADHVVGFFGGEAAWAVAHDARACDDWARAELARLFGAAAVRAALRPGAHATTWGIDPHHRGAYAYAGPGDVPARAALAAPVDERLLFAGEACRSDGIAGTVGGAARDGERAADWAADGLRPAA